MKAGMIINYMIIGQWRLMDITVNIKLFFFLEIIFHPYYGTFR